ncbi:MAG: PAS domain-containing protein [Rhodospirillales bacterium]|nr:PAS domain-containing protein [Rhodospirillales bacterium]
MAARSEYYALRVTPAPGRRVTARTLDLSQHARAVSDLVDGCFYHLRRGVTGGLQLDWIDPAVERLLGLPAAEVLANGTLLDFVIAADHASLLRHGQSLLTGRRSIAEYRVRTTRRGHRWVRDTACPEFGLQDDVVTAVSGFLAEVDKERTSASCHRLIRRVAAFIAHASQSLIVLLDDRGKIDWVREMTPSRLGDFFRGAIGQSLEATLGPQAADDWQDRLELALDCGEPVEFRSQWGEAGQTWSCAVTFAPLQDDLLAAVVSSNEAEKASVDAAHPTATAALGQLAAPGSIVLVTTPDLRMMRIDGSWTTRAGVGRPSANDTTLDEYFPDPVERRRMAEARPRI